MKQPVIINGEQFHLEHFEDGQWCISHPQWSLIGFGRDFAEAQADLLQMADEIAQLLRDDADAMLSLQTRRLRDFCNNHRRSRLRLEK